MRLMKADGEKEEEKAVEAAKTAAKKEDAGKTHLDMVWDCLVATTQNCSVAEKPCHLIARLSLL